MPGPLYKYNPAFLTDQELLDEFFVRNAERILVHETIQENSHAPFTQHVLITGPRGIGKTTLVLRVAAEIRRDPEQSARWYPVTFAEENYQVTTAGEFWLEALYHIGRQPGNERWLRIYDELRGERDEVRLRERALSQLLTFADEHHQRLLLIVENLQMLLGEQLKSDEAWNIRHTLQCEPRIMLLATATSRFAHIDNVEEAMYEQFQIYDLKPLDNDACRVFWQAKTGIDLAGKRIRPIHILTGGNPRLLSIIADFAIRTDYGELMDNLTQMVDDHTDYFKSHLDSIPAKERKVFVSLAEIWDPATARQVAHKARVDINTASADLARLVSREAVSVVEERGRIKKYQLAERMYNIYYLMRSGGDPARRMRDFVRFMHIFYDWNLYEQSESLQQSANYVRDAPAAPYIHAPDSLAGAQDSWKEAIENLRQMVADSSTDTCPSDLIDLFIAAASAGQAKQVLEHLLESPCELLLEPLIYALRMICHDDVAPVAQEIMEVAIDIVAEIEERRQRQNG